MIDPDYQKMIDYAKKNGLSIPNEEEQKIQSAKVLESKRLGVWSALDRLHSLIPDEIKENNGLGAYLHFTKVPELGFLMDKIYDCKSQVFYVSERVVTPDGSGWIRVKPLQSIMYLQGNVFTFSSASDNAQS